MCIYQRVTQEPGYTFTYKTIFKLYDFDTENNK